MAQFGNLASSAKHAIETNDSIKLAKLMSNNFDLRRKLYGDKVIGQKNIEMVDLAIKYGQAAKFCGSGGCIIGLWKGDPEDKDRIHKTDALEIAMRKQGFVFCKIKQPTTGFTQLPDEEIPQEPDQRFLRRKRFCNTKIIVSMFTILFFIGIILSILSMGIPLPLALKGQLITAENGAVSSENPLCSEIGIDILKDGGSAADAAIATTLCIGVTNSYSSGIGGGGFAVLRSSNGDSKVVDFREEAPENSFTDMYKSNPLDAQNGGTSVAIPGEIRGLEKMHKLHGILPWERLFAPSVNLALHGWPVNDILENRILVAKKEILANDALRSVFAPEGKLLVKGDIIKREAYGNTLYRIGKFGADEFYTGTVGKSILAAINANGGNMTSKDFILYQAKVSKPVVGYYHGRRIISAPPPASGAVLISILNILEGYESLTLDGQTPANIHKIIESFKYGYGQRNFYGDPVDSIYRNITEIAKKFMEKYVAAENRENISDYKTFPPDHYNPHYAVENDHGTMHVSVLAKDGSAVSLTSTVNLLFGSKLMDPVTGVILNDEMDDFSIPGKSNYFGLSPSPYNYIQPGKRPLSSSVPTIVEHNTNVEFVLGASGGSRIITATANVLLNMLHFKKDPLQAILDPRAHHQLLPNVISLESEFPPNVERELNSKGHVTERLPPGMYLSGVQVIRREADGVLHAAADPRKSGGACGY